MVRPDGERVVGRIAEARGPLRPDEVLTESVEARRDHGSRPRSLRLLLDRARAGGGHHHRDLYGIRALAVRVVVGRERHRRRGVLSSGDRARARRERRTESLRDVVGDLRVDRDDVGVARRTVVVIRGTPARSARGGERQRDERERGCYVARR